MFWTEYATSTKSLTDTAITVLHKRMTWAGPSLKVVAPNWALHLMLKRYSHLNYICKNRLTILKSVPEEEMSATQLVEQLQGPISGSAAVDVKQQ